MGEQTRPLYLDAGREILVECFTYNDTTASRRNTKGMQRLIAAHTCVYENKFDIGELRKPLQYWSAIFFSDISWRAASQTPRRPSKAHIDAPDNFTILPNNRSITERKTRQKGPEMASLVILNARRAPEVVQKDHLILYCRDLFFGERLSVQESESGPCSRLPETVASGSFRVS